MYRAGALERRQAGPRLGVAGGVHLILTNTKYLFWGEEVRRGSDCEALRTRLWVYLSEAKNLGLYVEFRTPVFWGDGAHCE